MARKTPKKTRAPGKSQEEMENEARKRERTRELKNNADFTDLDKDQLTELMFLNSTPGSGIAYFGEEFADLVEDMPPSKTGGRLLRLIIENVDYLTPEFNDKVQEINSMSAMQKKRSLGKVAEVSTKYVPKYGGENVRGFVARKTALHQYVSYEYDPEEDQTGRASPVVASVGVEVPVVPALEDEDEEDVNRRGEEYQAAVERCYQSTGGVVVSNSDEARVFDDELTEEYSAAETALDDMKKLGDPNIPKAEQVVEEKKKNLIDLDAIRKGLLVKEYDSLDPARKGEIRDIITNRDLVSPTEISAALKNNNYDPDSLSFLVDAEMKRRGVEIKLFAPKKPSLSGVHTLSSTQAAVGGGVLTGGGGGGGGDEEDATEDETEEEGGSNKAVEEPTILHSGVRLQGPELKSKYHLDSISFMFGSSTLPDWDKELTASVLSRNLKTETIVKYIDAIIGAYGDKLLVFDRKSDGDVVEFIELLQLQYSYKRGMHIGSRGKTGSVRIKDLTDFATKLSSNNSQARPAYVSSEDAFMEAASQTLNAPRGQQDLTVVRPFVPIDRNEAREKHLDAIDAYNMKYDQHGKPIPVVHLHTESEVPTVQGVTTLDVLRTVPRPRKRRR